MYDIISFRCIDTRPGGRSAFAPPPGWAGNYAELMRRRWREGPGVRQHFAIVGWMLARSGEIQFLGPYAKEARRIAERIAALHSLESSTDK